MLYVTKVRSFKSIRTNRCHYASVFNFSTLSEKEKSSKLHIHEPQTKKKTVSKDNIYLFDEIIDILGSENLIIDRSFPGQSISKEPVVGIADKFEGHGYCTQGVRENAHEKFDVGSKMMPGKRDFQMQSSREYDVSATVNKITEIVRAEKEGISLEERLDNSGFEIGSEITDKVLKRCFKVPRMAMRFFNWVKLRNERSCSAETYNTMLYIAGEAKEFELVEELVEEMEENKFEKDAKTWTILLMHYGKANLTGKALLIFEKMKRSGCEPDAKAYRLIIRLLSADGKDEIAFEFYKEMVQKHMGQELDIGSYQLLLNCLASSGDLASMRSVADDMMRASQIPEHDVYLCVLKSLCISKRIREALELIRDLKNNNLTLNPEYFQTLVKGLCVSNRIDDAVEIFGIMKKRNMVNEKVYGIIISGYLRRKDITKALNLFHDMKESGILPATSTYTELMQYQFNQNEYERGFALFDEMLERGIKLDSVAFMAIVVGYVRQNSISLAWQVFKSMEEKGIRATYKFYSIFIKELCKTSMTDEVLKVLKNMQDSEILIDERIFSLVISYLERKRETVKAEEVKKMQSCCKLRLVHCNVYNNDISQEETHNIGFNSIEPKRDCLLLEPLPNAYNNEDLHKICLVLSSSKDWHAMEEALNKCKIHFTPSLVVEILRNCSLQGCAVLHFFSWVRKQPGYRHTTETYNMAIKIAGCGKDFRHMRILFHEMNRNSCTITSNTWTTMIMLYGRVGLTDIALRNFKEMKASGIKPTVSTYKYLILSLCGRRGRNVDEAIKLFQTMISAGLVPDKELIESYFDCLCKSDKLLDARSCMYSLGKKVGFTIPLCYSLLTRALIRGGKLEEALALMGEVEGDNNRSTLHHYVYGSLVNGLLQKGWLEEALAVVESMKQAGIHPTVHVYTSLIVHFFKENQIQRALDIFNKMWDEGCHPTIVTYSALICGFMNARNFVDALNLFRRMKVKGPLPDFKTYSMLITRLCNAGRSENALQLLSEMLDDGIFPSNINFRTVYFGLNREGKQRLARAVLQQKRDLVSRRQFNVGLMLK